MKIFSLFTFFALISLPLFSQLNELMVGPTQYKGGEPDFYMFPGRAALIVYSSLDNLMFSSTTDTLIGPV